MPGDVRVGKLAHVGPPYVAWAPRPLYALGQSGSEQPMAGYKGPVFDPCTGDGTKWRAPHSQQANRGRRACEKKLSLALVPCQKLIGEFRTT